MLITFSLSNNREYTCTLKKSTRAKRTKLKRIKTGELVLVIPASKNYSNEKLQEMLKSQEEWIIKTETAKLDLLDEIHLVALNEVWKIDYISRGLEHQKIFVNEETHTIQLTMSSDLKETAKLINTFILKKSKDFLTQRFDFCCKEYGFLPQIEKLKFFLAKGRWGSYSAKKILSLNGRLICLPIDLIDYIIVHELCHRNHLNHSKNFYAELSQKLPQHKQLEKKLQTISLPPLLWL